MFNASTENMSSEKQKRHDETAHNPFSFAVAVWGFFLFVFLFDHFSVSSLPQCPPLTIILDGDSHWGQVSISWCCFSSLIVPFFFFTSFDWNQRLLPAYFAPRIRNLSTFYIWLHSESTHDSPNVSTHAHLHSRSICLAASQLQCAVFFANEACQRQKCEAPPALLHLVHRVCNELQTIQTGLLNAVRWTEF